MKNPNIRLDRIIGEGRLLYAVAVKGSEDWDGTAIWLVAADDTNGVQASVVAQYDDGDFDETADWTIDKIGDFT